MKEFLLLFRGDQPNREAADSPERMQQNMMKWKTWMDEMASKGKLNGGQPLTTEGKTINGKSKKVLDGPFAEGKEIVGGYLLIKANDFNDAVELSQACPIFDDGGSVEIREIQELMM